MTWFPLKVFLIKNVLKWKCFLRAKLYQRFSSVQLPKILLEKPFSLNVTRVEATSISVSYQWKVTFCSEWKDRSMSLNEFFTFHRVSNNGAMALLSIVCPQRTIFHVISRMFR